MDRFKPWLETMYFYCSSELYDLDRLKLYLAENVRQREFIQETFLVILDERPFTSLDWEKYMNLDQDSDEDLYAFLTGLYAFLFKDGSYPDWD